MAKVEIILESGAYSITHEGGRIYNSVRYFVDNGGCCGPCSNLEELKKSIERAKSYIKEKGHSYVVVDKRSEVSKDKLGAWMGEKINEKIKLALLWRFNPEHEKKHYILKWINYRDFGNMIEKEGYIFCCNWNNSCESENRELDHEERSMEVRIQEWKERNCLNYEHEIIEEETEDFHTSEFRWELIGKANEWYKKLVDNCGFDENMGMSVHKTDDVRRLYNKSKNKAQCKIYLKKCIGIHYEICARESDSNGDFTKEEFKPHKTDESTQNIISIKKWLDRI